MKKFFLIMAACFYATIMFAQSANENEKVIETSNTKQMLYSNALSWASSNDPTCDKKIQVQDSDNGRIVVSVNLNNNKPLQSLTKYLTYKFTFTINIDCKDGKYRRIIGSPSVLVNPDKNIEIKYLSTSNLETAVAEMESVERISTASFQQILEWDMSKVAELEAANTAKINDFKTQMSNLGDSKKEKKEKKRIEYAIDKVEKENTILKEALNRWDNEIKRFSSEIDKAMSYNNDF